MSEHLATLIAKGEVRPAKGPRKEEGPRRGERDCGGDAIGMRPFVSSLARRGLLRSMDLTAPSELATKHESR